MYRGKGRSTGTPQPSMEKIEPQGAYMTPRGFVMVENLDCILSLCIKLVCPAIQYKENNIMIEVCRCTLCHREYPAEDLISFDGTRICLGCMVWHTRTCSYCGNHIWRKDALVNGETVLCPKCALELERET